MPGVRWPDLLRQVMACGQSPSQKKDTQKKAPPRTQAQASGAGHGPPAPSQHRQKRRENGGHLQRPARVPPSRPSSSTSGYRQRDRSRLLAASRRWTTSSCASLRDLFPLRGPSNHAYRITDQIHRSLRSSVATILSAVQRRPSPPEEKCRAHPSHSPWILPHLRDCDPGRGPRAVTRRNKVPEHGRSRGFLPSLSFLPSAQWQLLATDKPGTETHTKDQNSLLVFLLRNSSSKIHDPRISRSFPRAISSSFRMVSRTAGTHVACCCSVRNLRSPPSNRSK